MKVVFNKTRLIALLAISLFAVSCSVESVVDDIVDDIEEDTSVEATID